MMDPKLQHALDLLWQWLPRDKGSQFWPKEETLQGWFAAALLESGYASHPTQVLQELHFGEAGTPAGSVVDAEGWRPKMKVVADAGQGCWQFDLTVISDPATGVHTAPILFAPGARDLETLEPGPKLLVEIKALNSARTLAHRALKTDIEKLEVAREYLEWKRPGKTVDALLVVVATDCKDAKDAADATARIDYIKRSISELTAVSGAPSPVMVAPIYRERLTHFEGRNQLPCPQGARRATTTVARDLA